MGYLAQMGERGEEDLLFLIPHLYCTVFRANNYREQTCESIWVCADHIANNKLIILESLRFALLEPVLVSHAYDHINTQREVAEKSY